MPKHKKTRQEKVISDLRRKLIQSPNSNLKISLGEFKIGKRSDFTPAIASKSNYSYLKHDLFRTSGLTLVIAITEILIFLALKKHILTLPIGY